MHLDLIVSGVVMGPVSDPFAAAISSKPQASADAASWPAMAALVVGVLSAALLTIRGSLSVGLVGYVAAAVLAPALVVAYRALDRRAQQNIRYVRRQLPRRIATLAVILGLTAGTAHAWVIATELAKR